MLTISVVIPTLNSCATLDQSIDSIIGDGAAKEIIIVDSDSYDETCSIARTRGCIVLEHAGTLLAARRDGALRASGDLIAYIDSDQVVRPGSLRSAATLIEAGQGATVILGERVWQPTSWYARLSDFDKRMLSNSHEQQLDPSRGVLLPRIFSKSLLEEIFDNIPHSAYATVVAQEHAIIYLESTRRGSTVGYLPNAIWHIEPTRYRDVMKKNWRYGVTVGKAIRDGIYPDLMREKSKPRRTAGLAFPEKIAAQAFIGVKAPPYILGMLAGRAGWCADAAVARRI